MQIDLKNISKRFNQELIFKNLTLSLDTGGKYAITGPNGSGKSTLLQVISGYVRPSSGEIAYNKGKVDIEEAYANISIAAPYLELIEEFTLEEAIDFHFKFKKPLATKEELLNISYLAEARAKQVKKFSSGMKQRLKLALAFYSDCPLLLLDEPTSNLDVKGTNWYKRQIDKMENKTIIVASNQPDEYTFCDNTIDIMKYK
ncbi:MAG: ABC transporter ATP-binding protein [Fulvivirga sp.]